MILCAGDIESVINAHPIGVGLVNSAINLTQICIKQRPKNLVFLGTAGSYGKAKIGDFLKSKQAFNVEISYLENKSYTPLNLNVPRETLEEILVNSSNFICTDPTKAKEFLKLNLSIENMEFYAVQSVAKKFALPFCGYFYITNYCDKNAHEDFINNHKTALEILNQKSIELQKEFSCKA